jgi:hypothetical protein
MALALLLPPLPQPPAYHDFADQRSCLGLSNCADTLSNAALILAGLFGLGRLRPAGLCAFGERREAWLYRLFFLALVLVGLASGYYHLAPDHARLAWDRAAMALAFMAWLAALIGERVSSRAALRLLPWLAAAGPATVLYWIWSEAQGRGDLRPYALLQLAVLLLIPALLRLYPSRYSGEGQILAVLGLYLSALLLDRGDRLVFALSGGLVSGHTLKHLVAALAALWIIRYLRRRRRL